MLNKLLICPLLFLLILVWPATGQPPILLLNPSFEDYPQNSKPPRGWFFCGQPGETPPDVHPNNYFNVNQEPVHGRTYVGMVVRDNQTWEALGQRLQETLTAGQCYEFSLQACRTNQYRSRSRKTGKIAYYTDPIRIRLWGGNAICDHAELLAASEPIADSTWSEVRFQLQPQSDHSYFIIEAYYPADTADSYRGNVLIDQCTPLLPIDCQSGVSLALPLQPTFHSPSDLDEITGMIHELSKTINFAYGTVELINSYYKNHNGTIVQDNLSLHQLVYALGTSELCPVVFAINVKGKYLREQRIDMLATKLLAMGLSPNLFRITPYRKRDQKFDWIGQNEMGDLLIRIR